MANEEVLHEEINTNDKYMGYKIDDLSESLGEALGKNDKIIV